LHRTALGFIQLESHRKGLGIDGMPSPTFPPALPGTGEASHRPFPREMAFEFSKRPGHMKEKLPSRGGGIHRFPQTVEADLALVQGIDEGNEMTQRPA
jgi:hypothetical protein